MDEPVSQKETILIVDDNDILLDVERRMLEKLGYRVHTAGNGEQAVRIYEKHKDAIHLVILDVVMPGMEGPEVFARLKQMNPLVKVLITSGYSADSRVNGMLKEGCAGFIQKPFNIRQISEKIRDILDRG